MSPSRAFPQSLCLAAGLQPAVLTGLTVGETCIRSSKRGADLVDDNKVDELDLSVLCGRWLRACYECSQADISGDGKVDLADYALWARDWSKLGPGLMGDIARDGIVDMADLKAIGFHWGQDCNEP